jgi:hypothetical protein
MFFERPKSYGENSKSKPRSSYEILKELRKLQGSRPRSPYEIFEELRKLQVIYFKSESDVGKKGIERNQHELIKRLKEQAREILGKTEDPNTPEEDRDRLMAEYGFIMDQMAINLTWSEMIQGNMQDLQNEALETLQKYLKQRPQAKEVARSIFMLFHHGAGIDKNLTADAYQRMLQKQLPTEKFAREYVNAEERAKPFLEGYIAAVLGKEKFSLDDNDDYQELIRLIDQKQLSQEQRTCISDAANWYRRISYYQKVANLDKNREIYLGRAIELHKKLAEVDPTFNKFLDAIYQEQGIEK